MVGQLLLEGLVPGLGCRGFRRDEPPTCNTFLSQLSGITFKNTLFYENLKRMLKVFGIYSNEVLTVSSPGRYRREPRTRMKMEINILVYISGGDTAHYQVTLTAGRENLSSDFNAV